jgi:phosphatidylglycerophosphatase A
VSDAAIALFLLACFGYGCWAAERVTTQLGVADHVGIVWDEFVAFWLVLWLVPDSLTAQAVAFVLFRFFDTVKPPPIRQADRHFKGGFGVMFDDLLAAGYTMLVMALLVRVGIPF